MFSKLQYHGDSQTTFNEIPPIGFSYEPEQTELTIIMTTGETYKIDPADYEGLSSLTKGSYYVTKAEDGRRCRLDISEIMLNGNINEAMRVLNNAIEAFNSSTESSKQQKQSR